MIGIDTNVLVRFLTADDQAQYQKVRRLFATETVFIADTVWLETEWVLRYAYDYQPAQICMAFHKVLELPNVDVNYKLEIAIAAHKAGMDFADALHWVKNQQCSDFFSFDRKLINKAVALKEKLGLSVQVLTP
ncbi:type II toxin-antitoxin system VapC family toxin [Candidatus Venteria ishoeyi]|uniref:PIN domain protein n=1 Tax=Candidatus Venteria ishoeyi TaxID=1899563 RepID=A0A1H6F6H5_9GAMM|nr:type II toxin-antitoxin system VapC family toxin [Candidatus Venteria ishoeyi]SEH04991.1 PIN domain protein [Candidatus Venteria ishoeyi]